MARKKSSTARILLLVQSHFHGDILSFAEMPRFLWILMKNPVYMLLNIGGTFVMLIVTGFLTFAPKFIETQFYISRTNSSLITGMLRFVMLHSCTQ